MNAAVIFPTLLLPAAQSAVRSRIPVASAGADPAKVRVKSTIRPYISAVYLLRGRVHDALSAALAQFISRPSTPAAQSRECVLELVPTILVHGMVHSTGPRYYVVHSTGPRYWSTVLVHGTGLRPRYLVHNTGPWYTVLVHSTSPR